MIIKILCGISALLVTLLLLGCAAPNTQSEPIKLGSDGSEATSGSDMSEYSCTVTFYSEPVDKAGNSPSSREIFELESKDAEQLAEILHRVEWLFEGVIDRLPTSYDGEIFINNMDKAINLEFIGESSEIHDCECYLIYQSDELYFRYKPDGEMSYMGFYGAITHEQMQYIRDLNRNRLK